MKHTTIMGANIDVAPQPDGNILTITEVATGDTILVPMGVEVSQTIGKKLTAPRVALPPSPGRPELN